MCKLHEIQSPFQGFVIFWRRWAHSHLPTRQRVTDLEEDYTVPWREEERTEWKTGTVGKIKNSRRREG
jgi:hypothetical protein